MTRKQQLLLNVLAPLVLITATALAYMPAIRGGYIWDDDSFVTDNAILRGGADSLGKIWFEFRATDQYYPMAYSSFWLEYRLWGYNPLGSHIVNVVLHAINALLLWQLLRVLNVPGAWIAAFVFALHPVEVESVAWITERKNVLSTTFYFLAFLAYLRFCPLPEGRRDWRFYPVVILLFLCALWSKTVACSLPAALLVVHWWKQDRVRWRDVAPLLPLFVIGAGLGFLTAWMEKHVIGAKGNDWSLTTPDRFLIAGRALWFYLGKLLWPSPLIFIYPRWDLNPAAWWQWLFPVAAAGLAAALWRWRSVLGKAPMAAALFFAITLFPALGFFDVYPFRYSFVADHFQYLASVGPIALAAGGVALGIARLKSGLLHLPVRRERAGVRAISSTNGIGNSKSPSPQPSPGVPGEGVMKPPKQSQLAAMILWAPILTILGVLTWHQCLMYSDIKTFYQTIIADNPGCWMAHDNLSVVLLQEGRADDSMDHSRRSLMLKPDDATADVNLGNGLISQGRVDEAVWQYERALAARPDFPEAESDLGNALLFKREFDKAVTHYSRAIQLKADYAEAHNNLGYALMQMGDLDQAIVEFKKALALRADYTQARENLGNAMARRG